MSSPQSLDPERVRQGATLRQFREMRGLSLDQLGNALNPPRSRPYLANIEAGRKPLTPVLLAQFCDVLRVPQAALVRPDLFGATAA